MQQKEDKIMGCLYGQAIGNALGIITEFMDKPQVLLRFPDDVTGYIDDIGEWEDDDTNQMLCILNELAENHRIDSKSLAARLRHWLDTDGRGCGAHVYNVLTHREFLNDPERASRERWELSNCHAAPNGALMRTSVIGLWPSDLTANAETAARVTHFDPRCIGSSVIVSQIIHSLVWENHEMTLDEILALANHYDARIAEWVQLAHDSVDLEAIDLDEPSSIGYTLRTLAAALWCYWHAETFTDALIPVVNEAGDADTNAAVACALMGAKLGYSAIPSYYITHLLNEDRYRTLCQAFTREALAAAHT